MVGLLEAAGAWTVGAVLLHASYMDLRRAHVHDAHWILVAAVGIVVAVVHGALSSALMTAAILGVFSLALWLFKVWGSGDALLLTALGLSVYPVPGVFFYVFSIIALTYLFFHKILRRKHARFAPVFFLTWVAVYSMTGAV